MKTYPPVVVGAIYRDRDKRSAHRRLKVEALYNEGHESAYARCRLVNEQGASMGRTSTILLSRLQSRDYALVFTPAGNVTASAPVAEGASA